VYYAKTSSTDGNPDGIRDVTAPGIVESSAQVIPGAVLFRVIADADDVVRGVIQYLDGDTWKKVELAKSQLVPREWIGQLPNPIDTAGGRYDIQLLDSGANVGTGRFKGAGYVADASGLPPSATVVVQTDPEPPLTPLTVLEDDWSPEPVIARLVVPADVIEDWSFKSVEEEIAPDDFVPRDIDFDPVEDGVTIDEDGIFKITFVKGSQSIERIVKVDRKAPTITFEPIVEVLFPEEVVDDSLVTVTCQDVVAKAPGIASGNVPGVEGVETSCSTVTPDPDTRGQITATSVDVAGNPGTAEQTLVLVNGAGWNP
jgi:hypothetical protein